MRLPPFVSSQAVAEQLNWANSVKREVSQAARDLGEAGWQASHLSPQFYDDIVRLLAEPAGGLRLNTLVTKADPKARGLSRALLKRVAEKLQRTNTSHEQVVELVTALLSQGQHALAAWLTFDVLSNAMPGAEAPPGLRSLTDLIEADATLRSELGTYWTDWQRPQDAPPPDDEESRWSAVRAKVQAWLDCGEPFDATAPALLREAADQLDAIVGAWRERQLLAAETARTQDTQRREACLAQLQAAAVLLPERLDWVGPFRATISPDALRDVGTPDLEAAATWADKTARMLAVMDLRFEAAKQASNADDSDDTLYQAYTQLRDERKHQQTTVAAEVHGVMEQLRGADRDLAGTGAAAAAQEPETGLVEADTDVSAPPTEESGRVPAQPEPPVPALDDAAPSSPAPAAEGVPPSTAAEPEPPAPTGAPAAAPAAIDPLVPQAEALVQRALENGRYGLAAHLARAAEALEAARIAEAGSAVLKALCVGDALNEMRRGSIEVQYGKLLPDVLGALEVPAAYSKPFALLALAGALRPALFLPHSDGAVVLHKVDPQRLGPRLQALGEFIVTDLPRRGGALDVSAIGPANDVHATKAAVGRARQRVIDTADRAVAKTAPYARATRIWQNLFKKGPVHEAVAALRTGTSDVQAIVGHVVGELNRDPAGQVDMLDRQARKKNDAPLVGKARDWLVSGLEGLAGDLEAWLAADRRARAVTPSHQVQLHHELRDLLCGALSEVDALAAEPSLAVACAVCRHALDSVLATLNGQATPDGIAGLSLDMLLNDDLLLLDPYVDHKPDDPWTKDAAARTIQGAEAVVAEVPDFRHAFERLLAASFFEPAEKAAARLAAEGQGDPAFLERIAQARLRVFEDLREDVERLRVQADDLLGADAQGTIDPAVAGQLEALWVQLTAAQDDVVASQRIDLAARRADLERIGQTLQDGADRLLAPLQEQVDQLERRGSEVDTLRELVRKRDLTSLRESLDGWNPAAGLRDGGDGRRSTLQSFGTSFASQGFAALPPGRRSVGKALADAEAGRRSEEWDFARMAEPDRSQAVKLLRAWQALLAPGQNYAAVRDFLLEIGLARARIEKDSPLNRARSYRVALDPTTDRRDCPVPAFGSAANGKLNVLVADWHSPDVTDLLRQMRALDGATAVPALVIVKGLMTAEQRVRFIKEVRQMPTSLSSALLDEAGVLFLATRPNRSRRDMFAVTLPAGAVQPYSNASSSSSPEMFFGRSDEIAQLLDQNGSCLVYGGRQLGKTALLQQLRVRYHRPPSLVVAYGSLQGTRDLWRLTAQLLRESGIPCDRDTRKAVEGAVKAWLNEDLTRRVLFLIDEADYFLAAEIEDQSKEHYKELIAVRDLMQGTKRQCKFVFAGLHDVQRLARTPNSPLHHFGLPLRIGPLFGKDLEDARHMVTVPMEAAGVVFDSLSLPNRILSAVGFYPSLLQTFGTTLLNQVNRTISVRVHAGSMLPIVVGERDVQAALDDNSFKEDIEKKFRMTLDLDARYKLITLAMLHRTLDLREQGEPARPLSDVNIQQLAQGWWPHGFAESASLSAFQGLLREMEGLGVLRHSGDGYVIRSSRIAAMLGGRDQIDRELVELSNEPAPDKTDTGSLRRLEGRSSEPAPLSYRQESSLLDRDGALSPVVLTLSSKALGLDSLAASLEMLPTDAAVEIRRWHYGTARELQAALDEAGHVGKRTKPCLAVVTGPWLGRAMVDMALATVRVRTARWLRVLLVPQTIDWDEADAEDAGLLWGAEVLTLSPLGQTGLRQWLTAHEGPTDADAVRQLQALTGGFPALFGRLPQNAARRIGAKQDGLALEPPVRLEELGLDDERLLQAARIIAELEIREDHAKDLDDMGVRNARKAAEHLERIGILERTGIGGLELDLNPLVRRMLAPAP